MIHFAIISDQLLNLDSLLFKLNLISSNFKLLEPSWNKYRFTRPDRVQCSGSV